MTNDHENLPDLDEARGLVEQSRRQAEQDWTQASARARGRLTLADRLRRLREENGFDRLFEEAFGGGRG